MSFQHDEDKQYLDRAIALSRHHMQGGAGGPFGAVVVKNGQILSEGWNQVTSTNDPTAHAEVVAIRSACRTLDTFSLEGATIYASCEPCPMCLAAIYWARLDRIVFASTRDEAAAAGFDDALLYREVTQPPGKRAIPTVRIDLPEARAVFDAWTRKTDKIPY